MQYHEQLVQNGIDTLFRRAKEAMIPPHQFAVDNGNEAILVNHAVWPEPQDIKASTAAERKAELEMLARPLCGDYDDLASRLSRAIGAQYQFPVSSTFMLCLGAISMAMQTSFTYDYYGESSPTNLYVMVSQPPSSGKSGVLDSLTDPVREEMLLFAKKTRGDLAKAKARIKRLSVELDKAEKDGANLSEIEALTEELINAQEHMATMPDYSRPIAGNATIEGLEKMAARQCGIVNMATAEAGGINNLLGLTYGDNRSKSNLDLVLQGWDNEYLCVERMGRETFYGRIRASFVVAAQDEIIDSLLEVGARGTGAEARFLILREDSMLGDRDHEVFIPVNPELKFAYRRLIQTLVNAPKTVFTISEEARSMIAKFRNVIEKELKSGGRYGASTMQGLVGKMDKHIIKLACALHAAEHWVDGGSQSTVIEEDAIVRAHAIFKSLILQYERAADDRSSFGRRTELEAFSNYLTGQLRKKRQKVPIRDVRGSIKNVKCMKGISDMTTYIKDKLIPAAEKLGWLVATDKHLYINPKL
ncbi:MAG: DUF3987 domain-containing protein [Rickettsiales bacterium]